MPPPYINQLACLIHGCVCVCVCVCVCACIIHTEGPIERIAHLDNQARFNHVAGGYVDDLYSFLLPCYVIRATLRICVLGKEKAHGCRRPRCRRRHPFHHPPRILLAALRGELSDLAGCCGDAGLQVSKRWCGTGTSACCSACYACSSLLERLVRVHLLRHRCNRTLGASQQIDYHIALAELVSAGLCLCYVVELHLSITTSSNYKSYGRRRSNARMHGMFTDRMA